jgi:nitroreductase
LENARVDPIAGLSPCADAGTSDVRTAVIRAILSRKSVSPKHLKDPGPNEAEIHLMLHAALAAPDHGNLRPWRAVLIPPSRRGQLAKVFKAAKLEQVPDASQDDLEKAAAQAFNAPGLLVIMIDPVQGHAKATVEEQFIALGAALQNLILTAHSLGYGATITSGDKVHSRALQSCFSRIATEQVVAFISIGTPAKRNLTRTFLEVGQRISSWRDREEGQVPRELNSECDFVGNRTCPPVCKR